MKHIYIFSCLFLISITYLFAQKVAISGFHSDNDDGFSFVSLVNLSSGDRIYFTDNEYQAASNNFNTGEAIVTYTVPAGGHVMGTVIRIRETATNLLVVTSGDGNTGTISIMGNFALSSGADQLYAFEAGNPANPNGSITEINSYVHYGSNTIPPNLNPANDGNCLCSPDFSAFTSPFDNGEYLPGLRNNSTNLATFTNPGNWTLSNSNISNGALSTTPFTNLQFGATFPVEWLSFDAKVEDRIVVLDWATSSETNNDRFVIERSEDGIMFEGLGSVKAAGTVQKVQNYFFVDQVPLEQTSYYRIRQVDFDGKFDYSQTVTVELGQASDQVSLSLYPNPVIDQLHIKASRGTLVLYNLSGQEIRTLLLTDNYTKVDVSDLPPGTYYAKLTDENHESAFSWIVK